MKMTILISFTLILLINCDGGKKKHRTYILENATNKEVKVFFYKRKVFINSNSIKGVGEIVREIADDGVGGNLTPWDAFNADSIIVYFDKNRRQIYCICGILPDSVINILHNTAYKIESDELYRYTFTNEDYNNAEEIDGG